MTAGPEVGDALRAGVLARLGFPLDRFQEAAFDALDAGRSVLVSAPTGSGKTVVADYGVARARAAGQRAFYTTPLKALSNQKYAELVEVYGTEQVGLLTGDVSHQRRRRGGGDDHRGAAQHALRPSRRNSTGLGLVVLDEVHYLQDPYRGSVWEEVIILAPPEVVFVCLSATVSNAAEFGAWLSSVRGPTDVVVEKHRPVELRNHVAIAEKGSRRVELVPLLHEGKLRSPGPRARPTRGAAWPGARAACVTRAWRAPAGAS